MWGTSQTLIKIYQNTKQPIRKTKLRVDSAEYNVAHTTTSWAFPNWSRDFHLSCYLTVFYLGVLVAQSRPTLWDPMDY